MSKKILFSINENNIEIKIPVSLLKFAAENNSECPMRIKNEKAFAKEVMSQLEDSLGNDETGLTGFQMLLDKACEEVLESGSDNVEEK